MKKINISGRKFGKLTALYGEYSRKTQAVMWTCSCECGGTHIARTGDLIRGWTIRCRNSCHNVSGTREYIAWHNMIKRCCYPHDTAFNRYGAIGINVCDRWMSFTSFFEDMGLCPDGYQIDRQDNSKGYYPWNCKWVTPTENSNNTKASRWWIVFGKLFSSNKEAATLYGVSSDTIRAWCRGRTIINRKGAERIYPQIPLCYTVLKYSHSLSHGIKIIEH